MGVGNIFVATTLAPVVVLFASVSLNLLTIGLEKLAICGRSPCPWLALRVTAAAVVLL